MQEEKSILYIVRYPLHENFHLKQKFDGQINAFRSLGYHAEFIGFDTNNFYLINKNEKKIIGKTRYWIPNYFHTFLYDDLYKTALDLIKKKKYSVIYFRNAAVFRSQYVLIKEIKKKKCRFIFEFPTYTPTVKERTLSIPRQIFNFYSNIWWKKIKNLPDFYTYFGNEGYTSIYGIPAKRLDNGIDLEFVPIRTPINIREEIHILAISSMCDWHGYDRLIRSLAEYKGDKKAIIHLVGGNGGGFKDKWEALAAQLGIRDNVVFHGALYGDEFNKIFDLSDIGVSSLGMYRKGYDSTSELKLREYVARGLPFVYSVNDPALLELSSEYSLKVSNDDTIPNMQEILDFAERQKDCTENRFALRDYAKHHMTWIAQYKDVL